MRWPACFLLLAMLLLATSTASGAPLFACKYLPIGVGNKPVSVATADVNGDGKLDVIVANAGSNTVSVLLGDGEGGFSPPVSYATGAGPFCVAIADFNHDGTPDLAVANSHANSVSILLGVGGGAFGPGTDVVVGTTPLALDAGDVDGDGNPDVVVANSGSNAVSILLGNGNGSFTLKVVQATGASPSDVHMADLNGDGKLDCVVANGDANTVSVLMGNGDGTFAAKVDYPTPVGPYSIAGPYSVAVGDVNHDGKPDLAVANYGSRTVSVLLGQGDGTFATHVDYATAPTPNHVAIADINGDGNPDLVMAGYAADTMTVLLGRGDGVFPTRLDTDTDPGPATLAIADLDLDGHQDAIVANYKVGSLWVMHGRGNGRFGGQRQFQTAPGPVYVAMGDLNGDEKPDAVVACQSSNGISVLLGDGLGGFGPHVDYPTGPWPSSVAIGDLNHDGRADVVVANYGGYAYPSSNTVSVFLGNGDGSLRSKVDYVVDPGPAWPVIGDFNNDGNVDIAVTDGYVAPDSEKASVLLGRGDGTFLPKLDVTVPIADGVLSGDFNRDGKPDLAVESWGAGVVDVLLGNGDGTFRAGLSTPVGAPCPFAVADVNGDTMLDMITAPGSDFVKVVLGRGDGTFGAVAMFPAGVGPDGVAIADFSGDGWPDAIVSNPDQFPSHDVVSVLLNDRHGAFPERLTFGTDDYPGPAAIADLNADGKPDVIIPLGTGIEVLMNTRSGIITPVMISAEPPEVASGRVSLHWLVAADGVASSVMRCDGSGVWTSIGSGVAEGPGKVMYADRTVRPGGRYGYRLRLDSDGGTTGGEIWVTVPLPQFTLDALRPSPSRGLPNVVFSLPDGSRADLTLLDVAGRIIATREVGALGFGRHVVAFNEVKARAGVYWVRLTRGSKAILGKAVVVE